MKQFDWIMDSTAEEVRRVIGEAMEVFSASKGEGYGKGIDEYHFRLVLDEALDNALHHGNGGDAGKKIRLGIVFGNGYIDVTVKDDGTGFLPGDVANPLDRENLMKRRGRGIHLIKALGNATWDDDGTRIRIRLEENPE